MSAIGPEGDSTPIDEAIERDFASIMGMNLQIARIVGDRDAILDSIRGRIVAEGVTPDKRFLATALYSGMIKTRTPGEITQSIELMKDLDRQLREHSGETIAWLDTDVETITHRDPGPNEDQTTYYLNLGILPSDSQLASFRDAYAISFEKAARIQIFNNLDDELAWDMNLGGEWGHHFIGEPELISRQPIYISAEGKFIPFAKKRVEAPLPIIGNDAVAEILETNGLTDNEAVLRAAQLLNESLAA